MSSRPHSAQRAFLVAAIVATALAVGGCTAGTPVVSPSDSASAIPASPSGGPRSADPTSSPTANPTSSPTVDPSRSPAATPTARPTANPANLGVTWTTLTDVPTGDGLTGPGPAAVAAWGPGWVALGTAAWASTDGIIWTRTSSGVVSEGRTGVDVREVTSTATSVIAVGTRYLVSGGPSLLAEGAVWRSADGIAWDVIGTGSVFDLGACIEGCPRMWSIAAGPGGILVAGYSSTRPEPDVWHSTDGTSWQRTALPGPKAGGSPGLEVWVAARDHGFIAAGGVWSPDGTARAVTWSSTDGRTWAPPVDLPNGAGAKASRIVAGPAGYVVLGQRCNGDPCRLAVWASADGVTWREGALDGTNQISPDTRGLLAATGDRFVVLGSKDGGISAWISHDGLTWDRKALDPAAFGAARGSAVTGLDSMMFDLVGGPNGVIATGIGPGERPRYWVSP